MYDAVSAELRNKPAVVLTAKDFIHDAIAAKSNKGLPGLKIVSETVPPECTVMEQIEAGVSAVMDDIVIALTKPLTEEEKSPKSKEVEKPSRIIFKGNLEEVNRFFYKRGWTDGFPIIPSTEEAVAEMLTGTDLEADYLIGNMPPRLGKTTVEKIAINAVMAGALPTYMPVLIAGVQVLLEPQSMLDWAVATTAAPVPFWVINGPIRNDIHINSGTGALSPGDIANATIGRAMGLIIKNMAGARKGIEDMGTYGHPGKYSMLTGENEEESPWEPLHVENGFKREDSTISHSLADSYVRANTFGSDAKGILRGLVSTISGIGFGRGTIMMGSQHAKAFVDEGWTKKEVATFLSEYATIPAYRHRQFYPFSGTPSKSTQPLNPEDSVRLIRDPDSIQLLVAGGPGGLMLRLISGMARWVTKKIELPANWEELVKKYEDIVPTYVR